MSTGLSPFAADYRLSRGRLTLEDEDPLRTPFARDRDRIVHSLAFRRLKDKTQVFVAHEGDHFRTRLTHSLEVAQIARSLARALKLDEDLAETLALAHDLGHTPFGHAGERELDRLMRSHGGFDHNAQTLRIVTRLERRYAAFDGLNLTWETLEGLVKHNGPLIDAEGRPRGRAAKRGLPAAIRDYAQVHDLALGSFASAEAQAAAIADDIAYNAHDLDDGLRAKLFDVNDLGDVPLAGAALAGVSSRHPDLAMRRLSHETVRAMIAEMIADVLAESHRRLEHFAPGSTDAVRALPEPVIAFSSEMAAQSRALQGFLTERMYRHDKVLAIMARAQRIICDLFEAHMSDLKLLPEHWREDSLTDHHSGRARQVCDFIAGMTDAYAISQHKRLFDLGPLFR